LRRREEISMGSSPEWKQLHDVADNHVNKYQNLFLRAVELTKKSIDLDKLAEAIQTKSYDEVERAFPWHVFEQELSKYMALMLDTVIEGGKVAAENFNPRKVRKADIGQNFNMRNPEAIKYAQESSAELVSGVSKETKKGIREAIGYAFEYGGHPYEVARQIRDGVGLTERQARSVVKYRKMLTDEGRSADKIDSMTNTYSKKLLKARAENIARTETVNSANAGQLAHWRDMRNTGVISDEDTMKEWIVTPDDRLCDICAPLDGEQVPIDDAFSWGGKRPARHPRCRCAMGLVEVFPEDEEEQQMTYEEQLEEYKSQVDTARNAKALEDITMMATDGRLMYQAPNPKEVHFKHSKEISKQLIELDSEYPIQRSLLLTRYITVNGNPAPNAFGHTKYNERIGIGYIELNKKYVDNTLSMDTFTKNYNDTVEEGFHPEGTTVLKGTLDHEYWHLLQAAAEGSEAFEMKDLQFSIKKYLTKHWVDGNGEKIADLVSVYATESLDGSEFLAEVFAQMRATGPDTNNYTKDMHKMLEDFFKDKRGENPYDT
jgi:SPP1 gp7 family putative phage head morphogenesis protein